MKIFIKKIKEGERLSRYPLGYLSCCENIASSIFSKEFVVDATGYLMTSSNQRSLLSFCPYCGAEITFERIDMKK